MAVLDRLRKSANNFYTSLFPTYAELNNLKKQLQITQFRLDGRTRMDDIAVIGSSPEIQLPRTTYNLDDIKSIYHNNGTLKRCIMAIREEVFRNGYEIAPKWNYKCETCGQEYEHKPEDGNCDNLIYIEDHTGKIRKECEGHLKEPDTDHKQVLERFFKAVNENHQNLTQVLKELEDDVNIYDDAWLLIRQDYEVDNYGNIVKRKIKEFIRASPRYMRFITDPTGRPGRKYGVCLIHRDKPQPWEKETCPLCGRKLRNVIAVSLETNTRTGNPQNYYIEDELIHFSKYSPSLTTGFSPVATLWDTCIALIRMVEYIYSNYDKKRTPSGLLTVKTRNIESLRTHWRAELEMLANNKNHIPVLGVDPDTGTGDVNFVKLIDSIADMQFESVRNEFKKEIGALYGVEPFFLNDTSSTGGLNNEGLQITVTNRAVSAAQSIYNELVFPKIIELFAIDDYIVKLNPSEEKDEAHKLDLRLKEIQNAQAMQSIGFDVDMDDDGTFHYKKKEVNPSLTPYALPMQGTPQPALNREVEGQGVPEIVGKSDPKVRIIKEFTNDDFPLIVEYED